MKMKDILLYLVIPGSAEELKKEKKRKAFCRMPLLAVMRFVKDKAYREASAPDRLEKLNVILIHTYLVWQSFILSRTEKNQKLGQRIAQKKEAIKGNNFSSLHRVHLSYVWKAFSFTSALSILWNMLLYCLWGPFLVKTRKTILLETTKILLFKFSKFCFVPCCFTGP